ncbi:hypothetical protein J3A83DRAFT_4189725 [Scleroderma citrinum]
MLHSMVLLYYVTIVAGCQRIMEGCEQEASLQMIAYVRSTENLQCSIDYDFTPRALPDVLFCFMGTLEVLKATAQSGDVWGIHDLDLNPEVGVLETRAIEGDRSWITDMNQNCGKIWGPTVQVVENRPEDGMESGNHDLTYQARRKMV